MEIQGGTNQGKQYDGLRSNKFKKAVPTFEPALISCAQVFVMIAFVCIYMLFQIHLKGFWVGLQSEGSIDIFHVRIYETTTCNLWPTSMNPRPGYLYFMHRPDDPVRFRETRAGLGSYDLANITRLKLKSLRVLAYTALSAEVPAQGNGAAELKPIAFAKQLLYLFGFYFSAMHHRGQCFKYACAAH